MKKALAWVHRVEVVLAASCFGWMTVLTLTDVLGREVFKTGVVWAQKSAVYLMIWGGFLGSSLTSATGGHLRPELADKLWPKKLRPFIGSLEQALTAAFCLGLFYLATSYVSSSRELGDLNVVTGLPVWVIQLVIPYTFLSMGLRHLAYAIWPKLRPVKTGVH